ncbi:hypothetical protein ACAW74_16405 [Fibrella sp. WM1]|uniref:hypothetical protein n=1 Tax=Fibrella musci TaxID=3242485 RepID=UPI00351FE41B
MKTTLLLLAFLFSLNLGSVAQQTLPTDTVSLDQFSAQQGRMVTLTDYQLPSIAMGMNRLYNRIRKVTVDGATRYFHLFDKYQSVDPQGPLFSLSYNENVEMQQAIKLLKNNVELSMREKASYTESRYATYHAVRVGYFVEEGKVKWYLDANPYYTDRFHRSFGAINLVDITPIEKALLEARQKIDELKSK